MSVIPDADGQTTPFTITLDDRLCLALYTASRSMTARYRVALHDFGLTYPQYLVMVLLWEEGASSVSRIGERLSLESNTLSPLLKRLEAMGLVTRSRDDTDERLLIIDVTEQGHELHRRAGRVPLEICESAGMDLAEQADLVGVLNELAARLTSATVAAARGHD